MNKHDSINGVCVEKLGGGGKKKRKSKGFWLFFITEGENKALQKHREQILNTFQQNNAADV